MNYGLYLSASGVLTNLYRQDVFANNLANTKTAGYKPDVAAVQPRPPETIEDNLGFDLRQDMLDRLGGGVLAGPQSVNFEPGHFEKTDNPLDAALEHTDEFFAVAVNDAQTGQRNVFLTRDGRFATDSRGFLVTVAGGLQVLGEDDEPIQVGAGPASLDPAGRIIQNNEPVGRLQVAKVTDTDVLRKEGGNLFRVEGPASARQAVENPTVITGHVEASGTDPIKEMMKLIKATKAVTSNGTLIRYHDSMIDQAVNVLGRVVA